jgi:hypothetical protein
MVDSVSSRRRSTLPFGVIGFVRARRHRLVVRVGVSYDLARRLELVLPDRGDEWIAARLKDLDYG